MAVGGGLIDCSLSHGLGLVIVFNVKLQIGVLIAPTKQLFKGEVIHFYVIYCNCVIMW